MATDIDDRLRADAAQWRTTAADDLEQTQVQWPGGGAGQGRRGQARIAAVAATVAAVLIAVSLYAVTAGHGHRTSSAPVPRLRSCGTVPPSGPAAAGRLQLAVSVPSTGRAGATVPVKVTLHVIGRPVRSFDSIAYVLLTRGKTIVGVFAGPLSGTSKDGQLIPRSDTRAVATTPFRLSGCATAPADATDPDASRRPLPPGIYGVVATLTVSDLGARPFMVVSPPGSITVTK